ncbi:hypothetical protein [Marininema halotolerans]|uniref:Uncharacterized protein n=1 Tax=Marininema halotolerans TaxID=1155944 RepID=A0A1I6U0S7_9BACL|nr:hypothetical protein [Marininema halotolerans]SFS95004.1 hypothetical protein SAMN05444972_11283 [Marininema halotolerans]
MAREILDYAASVPLSVQTGAIPVPTTPARLQLASVGIFIPPPHAGANRVEITATVGLENLSLSMVGRDVRFRIFRDGGEIFNERQTVESSTLANLDTTFTFHTVDFNLTQGFHIYFVTVESIDFVGSVIGPITLSALAIGTENVANRDQILNYQASVPQSVQGVAPSVNIPNTPARVQLAGLGIFIPTANNGNNRVQLKATIGVQLVPPASSSSLFRIFRDGGEIFNTEIFLDKVILDNNSSSFHTIDFNVSAGFHVYTLTVEQTSGPPMSTQVIGPIVFSGLVIGVDTTVATNQNNQVLDYNASVPRSVQVTENPLIIPVTPSRLQLAGTGVFIPPIPTGANRVQLQGTIGCRGFSIGSNFYSQLRIRIFRDGGEIFNAPYALISQINFFTISVQTIDFNVSPHFHTYTMTVEAIDIATVNTGEVIGPITLSALVIGPLTQ